MKNLKKMSGNHQSTNNKINSIHNLKKIKGNYVGSGFKIDISDLGDNKIAKFNIRGEDFDNTIDIIVNSLKDSLKLHKAILSAEIKDIDNVLKE